jgi:hypothetical protein
MNRILVIVFATLALVLGALAFLQHADLSLLRDRIATLERERDDARKNEKAAGDEAEKARAQLKDTTAFLEQKVAAAGTAVAKAATPPPAGAAPAAKAEGEFGSGFASMFKTEEGRKMMRSQAAMSVKMMYSGLAKDLKLDPNTAAQVMQLIGERQGALTEASLEAMDKAGQDPAAMAAKMDALTKDWDDKLQAVLGDSGMTQLRDYERTLADRMMLSMNEQSLNAAGSPLEPAQRDGLLKVMSDERRKTPPSPFDGGGAANPGKALNAVNDEAAVGNWLKSEEDYQRRVLQSATKVLNPDQINALTEAFKQQTDMQKLGVKMWRGMGRDAAGAPPAKDSAR